MEQEFCKRCGYPLGRRPRLYEKDGLCGACINDDIKKTIDWKARQNQLNEIIKSSHSDCEYSAVIAISGGKDSTMIVKRLVENHGLKNPLLVTCADPFTMTETGRANIRNTAEHFDLDLITYQYRPKTAKQEILRDFEEKLNPMMVFEDRLSGPDAFPIQVAKNFGIPLVFYGENGPFEYGNEGATELPIFHPASDDKTKVIWLCSIYPYSIMDSLNEAREVGFKDLDENNHGWDRVGQIENYTQIDSYGYLVHQWTKYVKFGAQRVADIACRLAREGVLTRDQAILLTNTNDHLCDPKAKRDFCHSLGITEEFFDNVVEKHVNKDVVDKDIDGNWKRKDLFFNSRK